MFISHAKLFYFILGIFLLRENVQQSILHLVSIIFLHSFVLLIVHHQFLPFHFPFVSKTFPSLQSVLVPSIGSAFISFPSLLIISSYTSTSFSFHLFFSSLTFPFSSSPFYFRLVLSSFTFIFTSNFSFLPSSLHIRVRSSLFNLLLLHLLIFDLSSLPSFPSYFRPLLPLLTPPSFQPSSSAHFHWPLSRGGRQGALLRNKGQGRDWCRDVNEGPDDGNMSTYIRPAISPSGFMAGVNALVPH